MPHSVQSFALGLAELPEQPSRTDILQALTRQGLARKRSGVGWGTGGSARGLAKWNVVAALVRRQRFRHFIQEVRGMPFRPHQRDILQALARHRLLSAGILHHYLTRLYVLRRLGILEPILHDEKLGHPDIRIYHQIRLSQYRGGVEWNADAIYRYYGGLTDRAFIRKPAFLLMLRQAINENRPDLVIKWLSGLPGPMLDWLPESLLLGACNILIRYDEKRACRELLERYLPGQSPLMELYFLEPSVRVRPAIPGSAPFDWRAILDRLERIYPAADAEDRRLFQAGAVSPLRLLPSGRGQDYMNIRFDMAQRDGLFEKVREALDARQPLSLVRVGDGEAYAFPAPVMAGWTPERMAADHLDREHHWWGKALDEENRERIRREVRRAIAHADILGVPSVYRLIREIGRPRHGFGSHRGQRGLITVWNALGGDIPLTGKIFTEERCHHILFREAGVTALCSRARRVVFVGCWNSGQLSLATDVPVQYLEISPHSKVSQYVRSNAKPIYQAYSEVAQEIRRLAAPGVLVLVSAGLIGKLFCEAARDSGAVGIDIGCMSDYMVGLKTRMVNDLL